MEIAVQAELLQNLLYLAHSSPLILVQMQNDLGLVLCAPAALRAETLPRAGIAAI